MFPAPYSVPPTELIDDAVIYERAEMAHHRISADHIYVETQNGYAHVFAGSAVSLSGNSVPEQLQKPSWLADARERVRSLGSLGRDWDSYGSDPPNQWSIDAAQKVIEQLSTLGVRPTKIAASAEEGVVVRISSDFPVRRADIEFCNSGEIVVIQREADLDPVITEIEKSDVPFSVSQMVDYLVHG